MWIKRSTALLGAAGIFASLMFAGAAATAATMPRPAGSSTHPGSVGRLAVMGGTLPAAVVGKPYSYRFRLAGGGAASWAPLAGLPLGLALDPATGVLSGVPEEAGTQRLLVSASRGGAHRALGSASAVLTVKGPANGAATIWAAHSRHPALAAQLARPAADGSVTVPASGVASALYQAAYFQAVDNPKAPQHDLVNVLLADVAAQVYASNPAASASAVQSGLAALRSAFASAVNPQVPASAGKGLPSFGPTLVPQLTGALGVMTSFASSSGAGIVGPAATAVARSVYDAYLKTSIATGIGFSAGYAGFSDRSLYDVGDVTASGFHALVSGPAIEQAVDCGQANAACASVEDSLLAPVVQAGLGTSAAISVSQTPAQLQAADPTLTTMLSSQGLNVTLNPDGSLTVPAGGFDAMLTQAGSMNVSLTTSGAAAMKSLLAAAGDPASPNDVSGQANSDLTSLLPNFNLTLTGTLFDSGLASRLSLKGSADDKPLVDGSTVAQGLISLFKSFSSGDATDVTVSADFVGIWIDVYTAQWGDAVKNLFGIIGALAGPPSDEAFQLAQQTQQMIQKVFNALTDDLNTVEKSIQNVQATLTDMFNQMNLGFADIDFENHLVLAGLTTVEFTLGQLEYQTDLTDGDVVAFGQGQIQTQIQGTINQCLDLAARQLAPLDFAGFSNCASQFKTEALTSASNDVVEFSTPPPPAPASGDLSPDGTVATTLQAHGTDPAANMGYLLSILNRWYGLGTDPARLSSPLVNPGVWSEVALGYRELLDEYPQFSSGAEPDLAAIEGPGQQTAQLISALQQVDTTTFTNAAVQNLGGNYLAAFNQLTGDIAAHNANFLNAPAVAYGTPDAHSWAGFDPFGGINQPAPSGDDPNQQITSIPSCDGTGDPAALSSAQNWESGVDLPKSWFILYNLVGYANPNLQPLASPFCYSNFSDTTANDQCNRDDQGNLTCFWDETFSASLDVRFMGTDGQVHSFHHFDIPAQTLPCGSENQVPFCGLGNPTQDFEYWFDQNFHPGDDLSSRLLTLLSSIGGQTQPATRDVLDSEATQIISTEEAQAFKWEIGPFADANVPDHALYVSDSVDLTGALDLLQLAAQTLAPSVSVGDQALSDILYGQDQLPSTLTGPNNALAIFQAQQAGTGTQTLAQYVSTQQGRLSELETLLNGFLGSAQQTAAGAAAKSRRAAATPPPAGDLATANAPALTYSVLAQLATGASLDTDTVTVASPGTLTSGLGTAVSQQMSAASSAGAPITGWTATGLPPGLSITATTGQVTGKPSQAGTFPVTVTATDTVGSSVHNSGQATFTWTVTSATCGPQLIRNGGFESGVSPWSATAGVRIASATATPAFAGKWLARLGGRTAPRADTLSQTVTIQPSCGTATLSFERRIITNDPPAAASDTLRVQVVSASGKVLKTLATFSNQNAAVKYAKSSFSLKPFIGKKVTIRFTSSETLTGHTTSFLIDNVAVAAS